MIDLAEIKITSNQIGKEMFKLMKRLFPICRSITGNGVRKSLRILQEYIPLTIHEVATGTQVFDWKVPKEWNIKDAYVANSKGERIIDFQAHNIHVVNYSKPIDQKVTLEELKAKLHTIPEYPDWIPYITSYYNENWGFCLTHNQYLALQEDTYHVFIDSELKEGSLSYGEYFIKGSSEDEVLITCYTCHPSLCNDNLSGVVIAAYLARYLQQKGNLKYSYRFLFIPETIGAITWLAQNEAKVKNIKYGLVATCLGDLGETVNYKKTRKGDFEIDKIAEKVLKDRKKPFRIQDYSPIGSDERQFCSPGFNLPVGSFFRTEYAKFPEYHTSADNLSLMSTKNLTDSWQVFVDTCFIIENNDYYVNLNPKCEPQLGRRGLYSLVGRRKIQADVELGLFWVLNYSDGNCSLLEIANKAIISFRDIVEATKLLQEVNLLEIKTS